MTDQCHRVSPGSLVFFSRERSPERGINAQHWEVARRNHLTAEPFGIVRVGHRKVLITDSRHLFEGLVVIAQGGELWIRPQLGSLEPFSRPLVFEKHLCQLVGVSVWQRLEEKRTLQRLKAMGIRISVDDFGTGYSSLAHLKELPIDGMKIDRSFVQDLPRERGSTAIARAVMQMAQGLEITVIAEGVENDEQRRFLAAEGCDVLQGELISAPLTAVALATWVGERARLLGTVRTF